MKKFTEWLTLKESRTSFSYTLKRPTGPVHVTATGEYFPAYRGQRDSLGGRRGMGPPIEPDEDETFEIDSITDNQGHEIDVSEEEQEEIIQAFLSQDQGDPYYDRDDYF